MQTSVRRKVSAWLLLSVFVPMTMLTALHRHQMVTGAAVACVDCAHHVHHGGHLSAGGTSIDDCLLCQLSTTPYTEGVAEELHFYTFTNIVSASWSIARLHSRSVLQRSTRAPPVVVF